MPPLPPPPENHPIVDAIYASYEAREAAQIGRGYLGGSAVGSPCGRALWYDFRHCGYEKFSGRMLALFDTGHRSEDQFVAELRAIGCEVHDADENGEQFAVSALGGHFKGHTDGAALGVPTAPKTWHLLEFKTYSARSFADLKRHGVEKAKPQHFAQMQVYMHLTGLTRALYLAKNKDDDARHAERIRYDAAAAGQLMERAERIIKAAEPPPRISENRDHYQCNWCHQQSLCHGHEEREIGPAVPSEVSCRNCVHSTPEMDTNHGRWSCGLHGKSLSRKEQAAACAGHLFLPGLVTFAEPTDYGDEKGVGQWVEYTGPDGTAWRQGRGDADYSSDELTKLPAELVGAGTVDAAKQVFDVTVEGVRHG